MSGTAFDQMQRMKESLYSDLAAALDNHKVHIGGGLCETDVVGIIEKVKHDYMVEMDKKDE